LDQQKWSESKSNTQFNGIINKMKQLKIDWLAKNCRQTDTKTDTKTNEQKEKRIVIKRQSSNQNKTNFRQKSFKERRKQRRTNRQIDRKTDRKKHWPSSQSHPQCAFFWQLEKINKNDKILFLIFISIERVLNRNCKFKYDSISFRSIKLKTGFWNFLELDLKSKRIALKPDSQLKQFLKNQKIFLCLIIGLLICWTVGLSYYLIFGLSKSRSIEMSNQVGKGGMLSQMAGLPLSARKSGPHCPSSRYCPKN
jgi:hypothetical protein